MSIVRSLIFASRRKISARPVTALASIAIIALSIGCTQSDTPSNETKVDIKKEMTDVASITPAPKYFSRLDCSGVGSAEGFQRSYVVFVSDGTLSFIKGEAGQTGYEYWDGTVAENGSVTVSGVYSDTADTEREISFTGKLTATSLELSGNRGPRSCTVKGKLPNA